MFATNIPDIRRYIGTLRYQVRAVEEKGELTPQRLIEAVDEDSHHERILETSEAMVLLDTFPDEISW